MDHVLFLSLRKFVHTNLPRVGFALESLGPQAGVLPIEPPLLVRLSLLTSIALNVQITTHLLYLQS